MFQNDELFLNEAVDECLRMPIPIVGNESTSNSSHIIMSELPQVIACTKTNCYCKNTAIKTIQISSYFSGMDNAFQTIAYFIHQPIDMNSYGQISPILVVTCPAVITKLQNCKRGDLAAITVWQRVTTFGAYGGEIVAIE